MATLPSGHDVYITGSGAVSAFGIGADALWSGLLTGVSCARPLVAFDSSRYRSGLAAEADWTAVHRALANNDLSWITEEASQLMALAVCEAIEQARLSRSELSAMGARVGVVVGTLCSSTRRQERLWLSKSAEPKTSLDDTSSADLSFVEDQVDMIAALVGASGPAILVSTACASGIDAYGLGLDLIRTGRCDVVVAGGGDILSEVVHAGFNSVYSITKCDPKPFDVDRDGFVIGEGAGALVLEAQDFALSRSAPVQGLALGYGSSNGAFHLASPTEDATREAKALRRALADGRRSAADVGFILAHGTGTQKNDETEARAIAQVLQPETRPDPVLVSSIKGSIGHCMGAAGALSLVVALQALRERKAPPNAGLSQIDPTIAAFKGIRLPHGQHLPFVGNCAMVDAFGFGGCNAVALLGAVDP